MTNKEKAIELALKLEGEIGTSPHSRQAIEETFIEMAKWKDQQYKEEKIELLSLVNLLYVDEHNQTIIEDLKALLK